EPMVSANHNQPLPPLLKVPSAEQARALEQIKQDLADVEKEIAREAADVHYVDPLADTPHVVRLPEAPEDVVWLDDAPPLAAELLGDGPEPWQWVSGPTHPVYSGKRSLLRSGPGLHQHHFTGAANPVRIHPGDKLFVYVWLDPSDPPRSIQLQYH